MTATIRWDIDSVYAAEHDFVVLNTILSCSECPEVVPPP